MLRMRLGGRGRFMERRRWENDHLTIVFFHVSSFGICRFFTTVFDIEKLNIVEVR